MEKKKTNEKQIERITKQQKERKKKKNEQRKNDKTMKERMHEK